MTDLLQLLQNRNSSPKLCEPAPSPEQMREIIRAAIRVPDHAWIRPWRFLSIAGVRREALGEILERGLVGRKPLADGAAREKARRAPLRAPVVLVVVARFQDHPKVPKVEQTLSAGCAAYAVLLAAEAMGFAGVWRTGEAAFDRAVMTDLGLEKNEEIVGFIYLGTRDGIGKSLPKLDPAQFVSDW